MTSKSENPTIILGIDSAMNGCSAAIYFAHEPERSVSATLPMARGQAEALVPLVKNVVAQAGIAFSDIDLIVTTRGPGTFTGLRVGLSAARSFALALEVPLLGISTLEVLARGYLDKHVTEEAVAVIIESKRSDFYFQLFDAKGASFCGADALEAHEIWQALQGYSGVIIGDAQVRFMAECSGQTPEGFCLGEGDYMQPDPLILAHIGIGSFGGENYRDISPLYLRGAEVSQPKSSLRRLEE